MQVPRYWRMKQRNYRLTGVRNEKGQVSLIARPSIRQHLDEQHRETHEQEVEGAERTETVANAAA